MEMKKGFFGMLVIVIVIVGIMTFNYAQTKSAVNDANADAVAHEIRADRIAVLRNVILQSHRNVTQQNELAWGIFVQGELAPSYGLDAYIDYSKAPAKVVILDEREGMRSEFYLVN